MQVGIEAFCKIGDSLLIEPVCIVENKGLLRCYVHQLKFSVRYLTRDDPLEQGGEELLKATRFPHQAVQFQFVKPEWGWSYVEAGIRLRYSHVTHVPANTVAILVWAKLYHTKRDDDFHATQQVFPIIEGKLTTGEGQSEQHKERPSMGAAAATVSASTAIEKPSVG